MRFLPDRPADATWPRIILMLFQPVASTLLRQSLEAYRKGDVNIALEGKDKEPQLDKASKSLAKNISDDAVLAEAAVDICHGGEMPEQE